MRNPYIVAYSETLYELVREVNANMRVGYLPQGGVCFIRRNKDNKDGSRNLLYMQAMIMPYYENRGDRGPG